MKLTVSKLKQLIQETLTESWMDEVGPPPDTSTPSGQADYEDWERRARGHAAFVAMGEDDDEMDLELNYEEFDLATAALLYADSLANEKKLHDPPWAKAVYTVLDSQYGEDPGYVDTGNHIVEISKPSLRTLARALNLRGLLVALEDNKFINDETIAALPALKERVQALLAGEEKQPEPEPEPEVPEDEKIDPRFANLDYRNEALQRYKEGQTMKLTRNTLKQFIKEELARAAEGSEPGLGDAPGRLEPDYSGEPEASYGAQAIMAADQMINTFMQGKFDIKLDDALAAMGTALAQRSARAHRPGEKAQ